MATSVAPVAPEWIRASLEHKDGRDPLGLQTTTQDRLMPALLPDINELTRRARYLSFYAFILDEYRRANGPLNKTQLSSYIKAREWELGLAVLRCPNACASSPVGASKLRGIDLAAEELPRGESVDSTNGGYGLYYRTSMVAFDLSIPAGRPLDDIVTPIDVISPRERAHELAAAYRSSIAGTDYFTRFWSTTDPIPREVVDELAATACLCRLEQFTDERDLLVAAMFVAPDPEVEDATEQRRRSIAHFLTVLDTDAAVVEDNSHFRQLLWDAGGSRSSAHREVADQWAGLVLKDLFQDALCSIWTHLLREALAAGGLDGLARADVDQVVLRLTAGPPVLDPDGGASEQVASLQLPTHPELLRAEIAQADTATAGLAGLLAVAELASARESMAWRAITAEGSSWQPSVQQVAADVHGFLDTNPTVAELMRWAVRRYVLAPHERIAYSKLPDFTFRFRSGPDGLRFFPLDAGRFILAAIRDRTMTSLTEDLGYRTDDDPAGVTDRGHAFIQQVLG